MVPVFGLQLTVNVAIAFHDNTIRANPPQTMITEFKATKQELLSTRNYLFNEHPEDQSSMVLLDAIAASATEP